VPIKDTFIKAISYFNYANSQGDYSQVKQFLANPCTIHRVNHGPIDVNNPLKGTPDEVVYALDTTQSQKGIWPTLQYDPGALNVVNDKVRGTGVYTDGAPGVQTVAVDFEYCFDGDKIKLVNITKKTVPTGNYTLGTNPYHQP
jgi:hypothetical protein